MCAVSGIGERWCAQRRCALTARCAVRALDNPGKQICGGWSTAQVALVRMAAAVCTQIAIVALYPFAEHDAVAAIVIDLDEAPWHGSRRAVEHDVTNCVFASAILRSVQWICRGLRERFGLEAHRHATDLRVHLPKRRRALGVDVKPGKRVPRRVAPDAVVEDRPDSSGRPRLPSLTRAWGYFH